MNQDLFIPGYTVPVQTNLIINIDAWLFPVLGILMGAVVFLLLIKLIRLFLRKFNLPDNIVYLIRLPKEKSEDQQRGVDLNQIREEIGRGETIFAGIGGLKAQRGIKAWLFGRDDHFSFEIVANNKQIAFYVSAPRASSRYFEQQIQAHYPEAVMEEVKDYNIFQPSGVILATTIKTVRGFVYPIKTYKYHEADPMNSIINILSKLGEGESLAIQYIARSAKGRWHARCSETVRKSYEYGSISRAFRAQGVIGKIIMFLGEVAKTAAPQTPDQNRAPDRLSANDEEVIKKIEEKNSKAGLDVNVRIIVSSSSHQSGAQIYLSNAFSAFSQYNYYEHGNSFQNSFKLKRQDTIIKDFIHRRFDEKTQFLLNTEEMASLFHFPLKTAETPNILWLSAKLAAAPSDVPSEGILLGYNMYRSVKKNIQVKPEDRLRHMYVVGKSGTGKSQFLSNMAVQDVLNGDGVCVIDPHGDLIEDILVRIPPERAEDVIVFSPADLERPLGLNLLEFDPKYPEQQTFVINEMINIFDKLYDLRSTGGPIFEQYMRNAMLLVMSDPASGSTLMEIPKVLSDADFRKMKLDRCTNQSVVDFWRKEAEKAGGDAALANVVPYVTSKLTQFISNDMMRPIIAQQKSAFNFRNIMDSQKILLVDLPKGAIGELNAYLLGMIIVGKILMAALSRADMPARNRKNFYLYIDEFQNFTTNSIAQILSEARKYGLSLNIAHQYIGQLTKNNDTTIKDAVFGNVGTLISFRIGSDDAEFLKKEFAPVFNEFDLVNVDKFTAYVKLLVDNAALRPFSMKTIYPIAGVERMEMSAKVRMLSRLKHGRHKAVIEEEIKKRTEVV